MIFVPSGDQVGEPYVKLGVRVRFRCPDPSAFMTKMSDLPGPQPLVPHRGMTVRVKTIFCPSGDQAGLPSGFRLRVRFCVPLPSAFMTRMSELGPLGVAHCVGALTTRTKAIFCPSGDQAAPPPLVSRCSPAPSPLTT